MRPYQPLTNPAQLGTSNAFARAYFPILAVFALLVYAINLSTIGAPVFGSDEYAFLISGRYVDDIKHLYVLDPALQPISNFVFFRFVHLLSWISSDDTVLLMRVVHLFESALTILVVYSTFSTMTRIKDAQRGAALLLLFPSTIYIYAVMPEVELTLVTACVAYVALVVFPRSAAAGSALAGALLGVAILIKPHAVATLMATAGFMFLSPLVVAPRLALPKAFRNVVLVLGVAYLSAASAWRLCAGEWEFGIRALLAMNFYGEYLHPGASAPALFDKLRAFFDYLIGHVALLGLLFSPCIVFISGTVAKRIMRRPTSGEPGEERDFLASAFILLMLVFHLVMIAWFTAGAALTSPGEAMRLHGRYLGPVFPLLCAIFFHSLFRLENRGRVATRVLVVVSLLVCISDVFSRFKLFPWDYPLAFGFFTTPNFYHWDFPGNAQLIGRILTALTIVVVVVIAGWKRALRGGLVTLLLAAMVAGSVQTFDWAYRQTEGAHDIISYSRTVRTLVEHQPYGRGLVISDNRYGSTSSVLFNLQNAPRVLVKEAHSIVSDSDVKDAAWVLLAGQYTIAFEDLQMVSLGPFQFFPRNTGLSFKERDKPELAPGKSIQVSLRAGSYSPGYLSGFNVQEPWGSWTSRSHAEIELPVKLHGNVKVHFFGWTLPENRGVPVTIGIGQARQAVALTGVGAEYELTVAVSGSIDRMTIDSATSQPETSSRVLGTALSSISFEAL